MRRHLPPLNALKAFEAAVRHGSFVRAAEELGVTPPAVSQQIRHLEHYLDRQLFLRHGNGVTLTDAGHTIYPALADGFAKLAEVSRTADRLPVRRRLVLSTLPSVAERWLNRVVAAIAREDTSFRVELRIEDDPVEFARHDIDLRLCYGDHLYPELAVEVLCRDAVAPVCVPGFLVHDERGELQPGLLRDQDLIHTDWGPAFASQPSWHDWFGAAQIDRAPDIGLGHRVGTSSAALDFAVGGAGVALGQHLLAHQDLKAGRLIIAFGPMLPLKHPYCLVCPREKVGRPQVQRMISWLKTAACKADYKES